MIAARSSRVRLLAVPNPVGEQTRLMLAGSAPEGTWQIRILDPSGRLRRVLPLSDGFLVWDRRDGSGRRLPAGVYLATASRGDLIGASVRLVIIR